MKKRAIVAEVADLRDRFAALESKLGQPDMLTLTDLASKVAWLHERVDMVATKQEAMQVKLGNMRGDPALDGAAVKRLAFAVAQFAARLDRLEAPHARPPPKPKPPRNAK